MLSLRNATGLSTTLGLPKLAGETDAETHLSLVTSLASETDLAVWQRILSSLEHLYSIADEQGRSRLQVLIRDLSTTVGESLA